CRYWLRHLWPPAGFRCTPRRLFPEFYSAPCDAGWPHKSSLGWRWLCARPECESARRVCHSWCKPCANKASVIVNVSRVFQHRIHGVPIALFKYPIKTALATGVAGDAAQLLAFEHNYIGIAVEPELVHFLYMARAFALAPEPGARTRIVHSDIFAGGQCQ